MISPPESITCVECGGTAHLIRYGPGKEVLDPETPLTYRCSDCMDRLDVVWGDDSD